MQQKRILLDLLPGAALHGLGVLAVGAQHQPGISGKVVHLNGNLPAIGGYAFLTGDLLVQKNTNSSVAFRNRCLVKRGKGLPVSVNIGS